MAIMNPPHPAPRGHPVGLLPSPTEPPALRGSYVGSGSVFRLRHSSGDDSHPLMQDIDRGMDIAVVDGEMAHVHDPIRQPQGGFLATPMTRLRRGETTCRLCHSAFWVSSCMKAGTLWVQGSITERLGQLGSHKALDVQGFHAHRRVLQNRRGISPTRPWHARVWLAKRACTIVCVCGA